jgi:hypothetical protein
MIVSMGSFSASCVKNLHILLIEALSPLSISHIIVMCLMKAHLLAITQQDPKLNMSISAAAHIALYPSLPPSTSHSTNHHSTAHQSLSPAHSSLTCMSGHTRCTGPHTSWSRLPGGGSTGHTSGCRGGRVSQRGMHCCTHGCSTGLCCTHSCRARASG